MKAGLLLRLKNFFGIENSASTQSTDINGNRNFVDQSVNNNYYLGYPQSTPVGNSPRTVGRTLSSETLARAARVNENPVNIFLAGPYIEPEKECKSRGSAASTLRFQLFHRLRREKFEVSLGVYPESIVSITAENGEYHNAAEAELNHATKVASLVVMIPDSPGSFAEIGAFCLKKEICTKMIILADVTHEKSLGYLNTRPISCAKALGSKVVNVDYKDVENCFEVVGDFSRKKRTQIQLHARLGG